MPGAEAVVRDMARDNAPARRWLSIVGIGEDGLDGLSPRARALIEQAEVVFGGARHLTLAGEAITGVARAFPAEARAWPSPFEDGVREVLALAGADVCVLASGDPFLYGVGTVLARHVPATEMEVVPAASAFSLAAARLGWALNDTTLLSAHGRAVAGIRRHLHHRRRLLVLTSDADGPAAVAALLAAAGFGGSTLTVLEALGGARERVRTMPAEGFALDDVHPLNLVGIEVIAGAGARAVPLTPGLPDDWYENDGQLTKRSIRAVTLAALAPRRGELLWDIGAGAGSIGIEWMLADPSLAAIAIEERGERASRVTRNALALGTPGLRVVEGRAPEALEGLPAPDAIFVGGGASEEGVLAAALAALKPGGRIVVNAVTLETEAVLLARHAALGGELARLSVAQASPVAGMTGWRPAMPVTQWSWVKPIERMP
ncbi:precorrin-6y C5,15-methyltransferase (decarboxylating) subunit CbiE [Ancylobacter defluvii]|nr:precorrin-6y C5,15-methyltransferase (decarboxylating) subunit CbiE [Ancylobacter defluvii]MBS7588370.1 precorrin-6y C5,15-methyltransferase (decarboxylating) subunit CbiE [Ancylobacter defluvii]